MSLTLFKIATCFLAAIAALPAKGSAERFAATKALDTAELARRVASASVEGTGQSLNKRFQLWEVFLFLDHTCGGTYVSTTGTHSTNCIDLGQATNVLSMQLDSADGDWLLYPCWDDVCQACDTTAGPEHCANSNTFHGAYHAFRVHHG